MSSDLTRYVCGGCGWSGFQASLRGTVDFSFIPWCAYCGGALHADDPLGRIEREMAKANKERRDDGD